MSLFEIIIVVFVLLCCFYVSYTDIKFKKIGNPYTYGLVAFGLACQGIFAYLGITTFQKVLSLLFGGLTIAFLFYYLGIWPPGDSKLFWGVSLALPPTIYSHGLWNYPPFIIAVNTFVPYFLVMVALILLRTSFQQKLQVLRYTLSPRFLLRFALSLLSFMGLSALINLLLPFRLDYFSSIILFIALFSLLDRFVERGKQLYFLLPFSAVSILMAVNNPYHFFSTIAITASFFLLFRFLIAPLGDYLFVHEVEILDLKEGDVPANIIIRDEGGGYKAIDVPFTSFISIASRPKDAEIVMDITPEGLSREKVAELRELAAQGHFTSFGNKVKVQESVPFAPIILLGVILTIICRGVFIERLLELVK
jgi:preflagellin peptidase FlaK